MRLLLRVHRVESSSRYLVSFEIFQSRRRAVRHNIRMRISKNRANVLRRKREKIRGKEGGRDGSLANNVAEIFDIAS